MKIFVIILLSLSLYKNISAQESLQIRMDKRSNNHAVFQTKMQTTLNVIRKVMEDTSAYTQWLYACNKARLMEKISPEEWILFFQFDVQYFVRINLFFLNDPFIIAKTTLLTNEQNNELNYTIRQTENAYNLGDKSDLIEHFDISWQFSQQDDSVAVRYEINIEDKAPFFVRFLITDYIEDSGYYTLQNLKNLVE